MQLGKWERAILLRLLANMVESYPALKEYLPDTKSRASSMSQTMRRLISKGLIRKQWRIVCQRGRLIENNITQDNEFDYFVVTSSLRPVTTREYVLTNNGLKMASRLAGIEPTEAE